jgi:uncharacterized protein
MDNKSNVLNWFEIPATDLPRAQRFYEIVFAVKMERMDFPNMQMVVFPTDPQSGKLGGGLVKSEFHKPSSDGVLIYFNCDPDLNDALGRVEEAGGTIMMHKTKISETVGYMAFFKDTEGNAVAMHSTG